MTTPRTERPAAPIPAPGAGGLPGAAAGAASADHSATVAILLVDDRPENLLALEAILEPLGQRLVRANSGEEALKALLREDFAVILLDVQMPGLNGFETAQLVKARERTRDIPIIFLTAISKEDEYVFRGYSVGAVDYMSKPFNPDILRSKVAVFVDLYKKQQQLTRQEQMLREGERRELELRHRAELSETQARLTEVVGAAMDAIVMFDSSLVVTLYNDAAERMFCRPAEQAIGKPVTDLFPSADREKTMRLLCSTQLAPPTGECATTSPDTRSVLVLTGRRATGEEFPLEATVSSIDLRGTPAYTMIARDVTERRRQEDALKEQAASLAQSARELEALNTELSARQQELVQAMSARSRFYASMSHELRTPINAIIGYNTLLLDEIYGPLNEKQAHGIQRTHKAAKHLLELVNDVLDLSKIEAGKIELSLQPVTFPMTVEDLFVTVRPLADEHKTTLSGEHIGDPVTVVTDPRRVRQILLNLLSNAIKFGRGRPIMVRSESLPDGGITIAVIDEGYGIAAEDMPRIFDEFVQLEHSKQHGGTGLGLPISRRLATMLGGSLTVESVVDVGSTFRLTLPASAETRTPKRDGADAARTREHAVPAGRPARTDAPEAAGAAEGDGTGKAAGSSEEAGAAA